MIGYIGPNIDKLIENPKDELQDFRDKMDDRKRELMEYVLMPLIHRVKLGKGPASERLVRIINRKYNSEIETIESALECTLEMQKLYKNLQGIMFLSGLVLSPLGLLIALPETYSIILIGYLALSALVGSLVLITYVYFSFLKSKRKFKGIVNGMSNRDPTEIFQSIMIWGE